MGHLTDNPLMDACNHIREQDKKEYEYDHLCNACTDGFDSGHGVRISDEKFCNHCVDHYEHLKFYLNQGLSDREVFQITESIENL